jgi:hypothetical protein
VAEFGAETRDEFGLRSIALGHAQRSGCKLGVQLPLVVTKYGGGGVLVPGSFALAVPHQRPDKSREYA